MTDIADKIYAATGLTLGAEAAAAIGQMIQAENEKLRAALRGVLEWAGPIAGDTQITSERAYEEETVAIARAALGEKE